MDTYPGSLARVHSACHFPPHSVGPAQPLTRRLCTTVGTKPTDVHRTGVGAGPPSRLLQLPRDPRSRRGACPSGWRSLVVWLAPEAACASRSYRPSWSPGLPVRRSLAGSQEAGAQARLCHCLEKRLCKSLLTPLGLGLLIYKTKVVTDLSPLMGQRQWMGTEDELRPRDAQRRHRKSMTA